MAVDPDTLNDPKLIRQLMKNAAAAGMDDLVLKCHIRVGELAGQQYDDELEREFWKAIAVAEEIATQTNGKTTRLTRTRQKAARVGVVKCITDLAVATEVTQGFRILVDGGHPEYTAEAIVVRHPDKFPPEAVASAERKLSAHDLDHLQAEAPASPAAG